MKNNFYSKLCSYCLIAAFIFAGMHCFAQDTLVKRDGRQILGKVLEVSQTEVKYKKAELADGPVYIEDKATIVKIKYKGGYVDLFPEIIPSVNYSHEEYKRNNSNDYRESTEKYPSLTKLGKSYFYGKRMVNERQMQDILLQLKDPEINRQVKNARISRGLQYIGFLAIPFGIAAVAYGVESWDNPAFYSGKSDKVMTGLIVTSGVMLGASVYFNINRNYRNGKAVSLYQQHYMSKNSLNDNR